MSNEQSLFNDETNTDFVDKTTGQGNCLHRQRSLKRKHLQQVSVRPLRQKQFRTAPSQFMLTNHVRLVPEAC